MSDEAKIIPFFYDYRKFTNSVLYIINTKTKQTKNYFDLTGLRTSDHSTTKPQINRWIFRNPYVSDKLKGFFYFLLSPSDICENLPEVTSGKYNSANLFVGINGRALIMQHKLVERRELALPDAVHGALHVYSEVFVATRSFQRHTEVAHLLHSNIRIFKFILYY